MPYETAGTLETATCYALIAAVGAVMVVAALVVTLRLARHQARRIAELEHLLLVVSLSVGADVPAGVRARLGLLLASRLRPDERQAASAASAPVPAPSAPVPPTPPAASRAMSVSARLSQRPIVKEPANAAASEIST